MAGLEGFDEDDIAIAVVSEHNILVAAAGADREVAHAVSEELAGGLDRNVKSIGSGVGKEAVDVVEGWIGSMLIVGFRLGGSNDLAGLDEMAFDGFVA